MLRIPATSKIYVRAAVALTANGVPQDLSANTVEVAVTTDAPEASDWQAATWVTDTSTSPATYRAQLLIGPAEDVTLASGTTYQMWVRVTRSPEQPVFLAGAITAQ